MLEVMYTNTYSSKFVSFPGIHKYTNARILIYQGLFEQICIRRAFQHGCLGGARIENVYKIFYFIIQRVYIDMPRKRRKLNTAASESTPIPYIKYRVDWIDIVSDSGWAEERDFNKMKLSSPVNEGWLYSKDKESIKLFASYDREEDGTLTFGDRTMIPLSCVKKMVKIS